MRSQYAALMDYLTQLWSASDACSSPPEGCSEAEITEIQHARNVERLPLIYVEFLRHMGRNTGGLERNLGMNLTYPDALEFRGLTFDLTGRSDIFFFWYDTQGDCSTYFHVIEDDPILYWVTYKDYSPQNQSYSLQTDELGRLSDWLIDLIGYEVEGDDNIQVQRQK